MSEMLRVERRFVKHGNQNSYKTIKDKETDIGIKDKEADIAYEKPASGKSQNFVDHFVVGEEDSCDHSLQSRDGKSLWQALSNLRETR
jgi:hypothetical protein